MMKRLIRKLFGFPSVVISEQTHPMQQMIDDASGYRHGRRPVRESYRRLSDVPEPGTPWWAI